MINVSNVHPGIRPIDPDKFDIESGILCDVLEGGENKDFGKEAMAVSTGGEHTLNPYIPPPHY